MIVDCTLMWRYANEIIDRLQKELGEFFPDHDGFQTRYYIHAWAVECPVCKRITPLAANWDLDVTKRIGLRPSVKDGVLGFEITKGKKIPQGSLHYGKGTCVFSDCMKSIPNEHIVKDISENEREMLLAVYLENGEFVSPREEDRKALEKAREYLKKNMSELAPYIPNEIMHAESNCMRYLTYWFRLFNPRQLLVHATTVSEIRKILNKLVTKDPDYAAAIGTYLSMTLSKHLMRNCRSAVWNRHRVSPEHIFTNRRPSMMWIHPEINPFVKAAGSLVNSINNVLKGLRFLVDEHEPKQTILEPDKKISTAEIINDSILSWRPKRKFSLIVTDPPYYNDVQYPELLQFFQVWHSRTIGDLLNISPIPSTSEELSVSLNTDERDDEIFETRMLLAINRLNDLLEDDGVLVIFYAHKSIEGWKYVLEALRKSGFNVTSTHTLRTEGGSGLPEGKSSVFHSLLITARKRLGECTISIADLEDEVRKKIEERYDDLVQLYGDDRVNLMVAASGIVIETITGYSEIESFTKNTADYALEIGQQYLIELFAKRSLNIDFVDPKTMLYVWFRYSPQKVLPFSEFNQTLKAMGMDEVDVSDIIHKEKSNVRLLDFSERGALEINGADPLMVTSVIDAVQMILRGYMRGGISEATPLVRKSPYGEENLLHTIEGLAKLASIRPGYEEGEICRKFLKDWGIIYESVPVKQEKLDAYPVEGDDDKQ